MMDSTQSDVFDVVGTGNLCCAVSEGTLLVASGDRKITEQDWGPFIRTVQSYVEGTMGTVRLLVYSGDAAPGAMHRAQFSTLLKGRDVKIAVLTNSRLARGVIMAFRWVGHIDIKSFAPTDEDAALRHLELGVLQRAVLRENLGRLRDTLI